MRSVLRKLTNGKKTFETNEEVLGELNGISFSKVDQTFHLQFGRWSKGVYVVDFTASDLAALMGLEDRGASKEDSQ